MAKFKDLPVDIQEVVRKRHIEYCSKDSSSLFEEQELQDSNLISLFTWMDTPEGFVYWNRIDCRVFPKKCKTILKLKFNPYANN